MWSAVPADKNPVTNPMVALSGHSAAAINWRNGPVGSVQQFANTGMAADWSEADGGLYYGIAAQVQQYEQAWVRQILPVRSD